MKPLLFGLILAALLAVPSSSEAQLFRRRPSAFVAAPARRVVVARPRIVARVQARRFAAVRPRVGVARGIFRGRVR